MKEGVAGRSSAKTGGRAVTGGPGQTTPHEAEGWLTALEKFESRVTRRMRNGSRWHAATTRGAILPPTLRLPSGGPRVMKMRTIRSP